MLKRILLIIVILLIVAQFIQPPHNNGSAASAADITHAVTISDTVMTLLKRSCYDCHSNHTNYPWYSKITPVNWWLNNHINGGKRHFNFTDFNTGSYKRRSKHLDEVAETVEKGEMPLPSYLWIHKDAALNEAQKKMIIDWAHAAEQSVLQDSLAHVNH
ncbi:MAG: heme-binding domain-containing protein [Flavisolibacter sp.]